MSSLAHHVVFRVGHAFVRRVLHILYSLRSFVRWGMQLLKCQPLTTNWSTSSTAYIYEGDTDTYFGGNMLFYHNVIRDGGWFKTKYKNGHPLFADAFLSKQNAIVGQGRSPCLPPPPADRSRSLAQRSVETTLKQSIRVKYLPGKGQVQAQTLSS